MNSNFDEDNFDGNWSFGQNPYYDFDDAWDDEYDDDEDDYED